MRFKENWGETKERFSAWWGHRSTGRPPMNLWTYRDKPLGGLAPAWEPGNAAMQYLDVQGIVGSSLNGFLSREPLAEAMPSVSLNLGAGSMALYLGCEPKFTRESVWFEPCLTDYAGVDALAFDAKNKWFTRHIDMYRRVKELLSETDVMLDVPDIIENLDVVSAMRGPQQTCYDMYDSPDGVKTLIWKVNEFYRDCYDAFNGICHGGPAESSYTAFALWGPGRTAKVQCDHSALISPGQFRDFVLEPLREQCRWLTNSIYHLDGPDCVCHVKALMEIEELDALQWETGDGNPPAGEDCWDGMYRQVLDAGKGLWLSFGRYAPDVAVEKADRIVRKFGAFGFYFHFPLMERAAAEKLLIKSDREWKC